jgi:hypothetical protein
LVTLIQNDMAFESLFENLNALPETYSQKLTEGKEQVTKGMDALSAIRNAQSLIDQSSHADDRIVEKDGEELLDLAWQKKRAFFDLLSASIGNEFLVPVVNYFGQELANEQREKMSMLHQLRLLEKEEKRLSAAERKQDKKSRDDLYKAWTVDVVAGIKSGKYTERGGQRILDELAKQKQKGLDIDFADAMMKAGAEIIHIPGGVTKLPKPIKEESKTNKKKESKKLSKIKDGSSLISEPGGLLEEISENVEDITLPYDEEKVVPLYKAPEPPENGRTFNEEKNGKPTGRVLRIKYTYNAKENVWEGPTYVDAGMHSKTIASPRGGGGKPPPKTAGTIIDS